MSEFNLIKVELSMPDLPEFINEVGHNLFNDSSKMLGEEIKYRLKKFLRRPLKYNNELMYPQEILDYERNQKVELFKEVGNEFNGMKYEELCTPDPIIFDEILNSINENIDVQEIRSIYAKLLSASFIKSKKDKLSRELLSAVKQFSSYDAHVFSIFKQNSITPIVNYKIVLDNDFQDIMVSIRQELFSVNEENEIIFKPLYFGKEIKKAQLDDLIRYTYQNTNYEIKDTEEDIKKHIYNLWQYHTRSVLVPQESYPAFNNIIYGVFDYGNNEAIEYLNNVFIFDEKIEDTQPSSIERLSELKLLNISYKYQLNNDEYMNFYFSEPYTSYSKLFEKNFHYIEHGTVNLTPLGNNLKSILFD